MCVPVDLNFVCEFYVFSQCCLPQCKMVSMATIQIFPHSGYIMQGSLYMDRHADETAMVHYHIWVSDTFRTTRVVSLCLNLQLLLKGCCDNSAFT